MKMRRETYVYIGVMVLMLVITGNALTMVYFSSKMLPLIISGAIFFLAAIQLSREFLAKTRPEKTLTEEVAGGGERKETWYGYSLVSAYVVGFFLAIYLLNFIIAIPLFTLAYMKTHGTRWRVAITSAIVITVLIYVIFELALDLNLYQGLLFKVLGY